jgi:hypothetical protein
LLTAIHADCKSRWHWTFGTSAEKALELVWRIEVHEYAWKVSGTRDAGTFAQQLHEIYPVVLQPDACAWFMRRDIHRPFGRTIKRSMDENSDLRRRHVRFEPSANSRQWHEPLALDPEVSAGAL